MIRLGTRASPLALAQARGIAARLDRAGAAVDIVRLRTEGDRLADARLAALGGKGLFVREIEEALLRGDIDVAVHSLKDLPAELPPGLVLAAFPEREDPRDVLVTRGGGGLEALPPAAVVGTSSPRRRALLLALRPDLSVEPIRGNVDTRLAKLEGGGCDAIVLAAAGLRRLGLAPVSAVPLAADVFVPAVGQGILALEARTGDRRVAALLAEIEHPPTAACARAERAYLGRLGASCNTPVAAHATIEAGMLRLTAVVAAEDGRRLLRQADSGRPENAERIGLGLAEAMLARGAAEVTALAPAAPTPALADRRERREFQDP